MADKLADMVVVMVVDTVVDMEVDEVADEVRGQRGCRHGRLTWRTDQDRTGWTRTNQDRPVQASVTWPTWSAVSQFLRYF